MKKTGILFLSLAFLLANCKKTYVCQCTDSSGVNQSYNIDDTKTRAKKKCASYEQQAQSGSFSQVTCEIK